MSGRLRKFKMYLILKNSISFLYSICLRWPQLSLAGAAVLFFIPIKIMMIAGAEGVVVRLTCLFITLGIACFFHTLSSKDVPAPILIVYRGIVVLFALYLLLASPALLIDDLVLGHYIEMLWYRWGAPVLAVLAFFRISWTIPFLVAAKYQKIALSENLGFPITITDYSPVLEFGLLLAIGCIVFASGRKWLNLWSDQQENKNELTPLDAVLMTAVAVHFSNYFYSGMQKIFIANNPFSWALENPTYYLALAAEHAGALPITILGDDATQLIIQSFRMFLIPLNILTFCTQLMAIFAIIRIRAAIILTAFFDLMHLAIFILSGIFFYKWICLNLLIVIALTKIKDKKIDLNIKLWLMSVVVAAPTIFFVAFLGWYDTPSFNDEYIEAVTETGETYRVPSNYWLSGSVTYAQERIISLKPGVFGTGSYGSIGGSPVTESALLDTKNCILNTADFNKDELNKRYQEAGNAIMRHHRYILSKLNKDGRLLYDLYPHHIFSMPWSFLDFYRIDKRKIVGYRYVIEAKCLDTKGDTLHPDIKARDEYYVPVR